MKSGKSEIAFVVDRSASMISIQDEAIQAFNTFLDEQKNVVGECAITYTQFNTHYDVVHDGIPLQRMRHLNHSTFQPSGMTALLDAVGRTVDTVKERLGKTPENEKPENVILVILTDGEENASKEYTWEQVSRLLKHAAEDLGWRIIFLAQNLDSQEAARRMGLDSKRSNIFVASMRTGSKGWINAVRAASSAVTSTRSSGDLNKDRALAIIDGEEAKAPAPVVPRATGRGIARAQQARDAAARRRRNRSKEPNFD